MAGFLILLARTMSMEATYGHPRDIPRYDWMADPLAFGDALDAAAALIDTFNTLCVPTAARAQSPGLRTMTFVADMACGVGSPKLAKRSLSGRHQAFVDELNTIRRLLGPGIAKRLSRAKPPKKRAKYAPRKPDPASLEQFPEAMSQAIADAVLSLINLAPRTPTREEIVSVVQGHLKIREEGRK
jgi:hypothetical protein